jgi:hypothetical protein
LRHERRRFHEALNLAAIWKLPLILVEEIFSPKGRLLPAPRALLAY